jgi:hypothetical protein
MTRRELVILLSLLLLCAPAAAPVRADGDGRGEKAEKAEKSDDEKKKKEEEEKRKKEEERKKRIKKALEAAGEEFRTKDAAALVKRIEAKTKVDVTLGGETGSYRATQAKKILETWFEGRTVVSLELDRVTGTVGSFTLVTRERGDDKNRKRKLQIELREDGETLYLREIKES